MSDPARPAVTQATLVKQAAPKSDYKPADISPQRRVQRSYTVRLWSVRHSRALEWFYSRFAKFFLLLHPLWKSLVLPASGVALCWLLVMTLLLPPLDIARGYRSQIQRIARQLPAGACVAAPGMSRPQVVALEYLGGFRVDALTPETVTRCDYLVQAESRLAPSLVGANWQLLARERRNTSDDELITVYRRAGASR